MSTLVQQFEHLRIRLDAISSATNNFADENFIGKGGFGKVYQGELGQTTVAIKRLDRAYGQGNPEFWKEIIMLSRYMHVNIVSLLGFCDESDEKILVYEYASMKSLDRYLNNNNLTWIKRLKISIGAARGLAYLHDPPKTHRRVIHRDIKSSNILLDENWSAKISDLGLAKFGPANQPYSFTATHPAGTFGYIDPAYAETGLLTKESDVYSFGVVLFELLCGRLCIRNIEDKRMPLTELVRRYYKMNKMNEIIYDDIKDEISPNSLKEFITIAYRCLKRNRKKRPLMKEIVAKLETALQYQVKNGSELQAEYTMTKDLFSPSELYTMPEEQPGTEVYYKSLLQKFKKLFGEITPDLRLKTNWNFGKVDMQTKWDIGKSKSNGEIGKVDLQTKWDIGKVGLQTKWDIVK